MNDQTLVNARESFRIEAAAVERMTTVVDFPAFSAAVEALVACPRVVTCASGSSGIAAKKFAHSLCCIERGAMFMPPGEAVHGGATNVVGPFLPLSDPFNGGLKRPTQKANSSNNDESV